MLFKKVYFWKEFLWCLAYVISCSCLDRIESNDSIRNELDDIVGGLQGYLAHVKTKGQKAQRDYEMLLSEKMTLEDQCRKLEQELSVLDSEAGKVPTLEQVKMCFN